MDSHTIADPMSSHLWTSDSHELAPYMPMSTLLGMLALIFETLGQSWRTHCTLSHVMPAHPVSFKERNASCALLGTIPIEARMILE